MYSILDDPGGADSVRQLAAKATREQVERALGVERFLHERFFPTFAKRNDELTDTYKHFIQGHIIEYFLDKIFGATAAMSMHHDQMLQIVLHNLGLPLFIIGVALSESGATLDTIRELRPDEIAFLDTLTFINTTQPSVPVAFLKAFQEAP